MWLQSVHCVFHTCLEGSSRKSLISCPADKKVPAWIRSLATLRKMTVSVIFLVFACFVIRCVIQSNLGLQPLNFVLEVTPVWLFTQVFGSLSFELCVYSPGVWRHFSPLTYFRNVFALLKWFYQHFWDAISLPSWLFCCFI